MSQVCGHDRLTFESSTFLQHTDYARPDEQARQTAATLDSRIKHVAGAFCAPLILPGDDLAEDPEYPAQSLKEWLDDKDRNEVQPARKTLYVVPPPTLDSNASFIAPWSQPNSKYDSGPTGIEPPNVNDIGDYLRAFYHGLPVKVLPSSTLRLVTWDGNKSKTPRFVGLQTASECIRIRTRASKDRVFARQLNLDDLLDVAISILPQDAFALLMLVPYDIYESPEDDFACGRAYGGSRVAVISTARYHPGLDAYMGVPRVHGWPASHCVDYLEVLCAEADGDAPPAKKKRKTAGGNLGDTGDSPLHAAVAAHKTLPSLEDAPSQEALSALWLGRACRTSSHELGHCVGIDHCVYYACVMQGTSSLKEDARQPPFVCPVDLAKVLRATGSSREELYRALLAFCEKHSDGHLFVAFKAWLEAQL
uniref:Archaemetzincin-2 n=1 Tax=Mycena chlorophos TaxID=658473 RepID=A0ABQ0MAA4_MYCCL|nr:predicted protein [Mycena chlorophos]